LAIQKARSLYTIPISLYLGWIAVSVLGHFNVLLIDLDMAFLGMPQETWTILLVGVAIIGGLLDANPRDDDFDPSFCLCGLEKSIWRIINMKSNKFPLKLTKFHFFETKKLNLCQYLLIFLTNTDKNLA